jgi:hypothetical protein
VVEVQGWEVSATLVMDGRGRLCQCAVHAPMTPSLNTGNPTKQKSRLCRFFPAVFAAMAHSPSRCMARRRGASKVLSIGHFHLTRVVVHIVKKCYYTRYATPYLPKPRSYDRFRRFFKHPGY